MTLVQGLSMAVVALLGLLMLSRIERAVMRSRIHTLEARLARVSRDAMEAEARSRGVGGTGEHGAPVVTPLDPVAREWSMTRDPRFAIPSGRGS